LIKLKIKAQAELIKNDRDSPGPRIGIDEDLSDIDLIIVNCVAVSLPVERIGLRIDRIITEQRSINTREI
jgi:hypothetical protein